MAVTVNFSSSQDSGAITILTLEDTSTGSGSNITGRLVYLRKYDNTYLVPSGYTVTYIYWPYQAGIGDTIDIDVLDKDYVLDISVVFYSGSTIYATKTILTLLTGYGDLFLRQLTQSLAANRISITAKNFWYNKNKLRTLLDDAAQAVGLLNDQTIAQFCIDEEKKMTDNPSLFFN